MTEKRTITIRPLFRVLAGFISAASIFTMLLKPAFYQEELYFLLCWVVTIPLFLFCAVTGRMPYWLVRMMDDEMFDLCNDVRPLFLKFNATSIGFAVVAIFLMLFGMYRA